MKASTNILTRPPTSTAPIAAFIARLCAGVMAGLNNGGDSRSDGAASRAVLRAAQRTRRAVRDYCRAEFAAHKRRLKLAMLGHKHWRRLVLKELGGALALARWGAAMKRCKLRREAWARAPKLEPAPLAWRKTPEMMARELRLKAHARTCAKACAPSYISRDPCTMDKSGQFRLPPLPRLTGPGNPDAAWTTPFDLGDYRYDATPVTRRSGYNAPILIWPEEFEVAEVWDYQRWLRERCVRRAALEDSEEPKPYSINTCKIALRDSSSTCQADHPPPADRGRSLAESPGLAPRRAHIYKVTTKTGVTREEKTAERHRVSLRQNTLNQDSADERAI